MIRSMRSAVLLAVLSAPVALLPAGRSAKARDHLPGLLPRQVFPDELKHVTAETKVGSWVEYAARDNVRKSRFTWRIALVGKEGKNRKWWEYHIRWDRLRSVVIKTLIESTDHDPAKVIKMIWKPAGHQAVYLPVEKGRKMMDLYTPRFKGGVKNVGTSPHTVAAGTFESTRYTAKDRTGRSIQFWVSDSVPIIGLVRMISPGMNMELIKHGSNAKSMITEEPGKLPFPLK